MEVFFIPRAFKKFTIGVICLCLGIMLLKVMYLDDNRRLKYESSEVLMLKNRIAELENLLKTKSELRYHIPQLEREIPVSREIGRDLDLAAARKRMQDSVTVLMFSANEGIPCLKSRVENVLQQYPKIKMIVTSKSYLKIPSLQNTEYLYNIEKEGEALATMVTKVDTPYFLYLSSGVQLPSHSSAISVTWLLHAMEKIPELDFVGGSFLRHETDTRYPVLEVPCHRLRMCNWTMSQTFEYRYSVDDMMVCEETSSSFMGRMESLGKVGQFDPNLDAMATTDFFLRAKGKAVTGLRPEVQFIVSKICFPSPLTVSDEADMKFPFMKKHQLFIVRDVFKREVKAVDSKHYGSLQNYGLVFHDTGTYASPMYARGLLLNLEVAADFLESKNISYFLDSGIPLGGIKMGGLLPWDVDIDLGFFGEWKEVRDGLQKLCEERGIPARISTEPIGGGLMEVFLRAAGEFGYNCLYQQPKNVVEEHSMMYVYIHGRKYPVKTYLFSSFRTSYGIHYLEMHGKNGRLDCSVKGHHACVPQQFKHGGGNWREYYCEL